MRDAVSEFDLNQDTDALTGLPGRAALIGLAQSVLDQAEDGGGHAAFMIVEFSASRHVFQNAGFAAGEDILRQAVGRIKDCLGDDARLGWDLGQFAVIAWDLADGDAAQALAQRIVDALAEPFEFEGHTFYLYSNVGLSHHETGKAGTTEVPLIARQVNLATPREAEGFRNVVRVFDDELAAAMARRNIMDSELRTATSRGELSLLYQPRVVIETGEIVGAEALLRWNSRELGQVSPGEFAPLAEKTGHIYEMTEWAMAEACREALTWQTDGGAPIRVGINFSALMFDLPDLPAKVAAALDRSGLPANCLEIEITENAFLESKNRTMQTLEAIKALGVKISLDDFGTGFSAMSYLGRFPLDCLKIDRAFVQDLPGSGIANGIAKAVAMLAAACGLDSVAEGMETQEQVIALRVLGCQYAQGYYFSPPLPGERLRELVHAGSNLPVQQD